MEMQKNNNKTGQGVWMILTVWAVLLASTLPASGLTRIRDITRLSGERSNKLIGHGLVVGLNGTGDGDSLVMVRPLAEMLGKLGNEVDVNELSPKNVAYVLITAEMGRNGMRNGDQIDVQVHSMNSAKSLAGGTLIMAFLQGASFDDRIYGVAQGSVTITDPANPTSGIIRGGADIEENVFYMYVDYETYPGKAVFTLVLDDDHANFNTARMVAATINEEVSLTDLVSGTGVNSELANEPTAVVLGPKNVMVTIPAKQAVYPANFIARITDLPIDLPEPEARVVINETSKVITWTGNVEIAPVGVTVGGIEIQIGMTQANQGPAGGAVLNQGAAKLEELITAMNQLGVSAENQIAVIDTINYAGVLRATVRREK
ncbi:MAG: flagellar basal body P-ring protein FlgI [Planctomycetes bacterium]|nr:flagellar basal body P-ring protein FlgI [Planctomycetota bacterium]